MAEKQPEAVKETEANTKWFTPSSRKTNGYTMSNCGSEPPMAERKSFGSKRALLASTPPMQLRCGQVNSSGETAPSFRIPPGRPLPARSPANEERDSKVTETGCVARAQIPLPNQVSAGHTSPPPGSDGDSPLAADLCHHPL